MKKKEEFILSEKIRQNWEGAIPLIHVEDVKEFIKQLKGDFEECRDKTDIWADEERWNKFEKMFKKRIKERAGEKLK